jgi:putative dimethyl sulfoxide reductase chaperone
MNMANDAELNPQELANIARTRAAFNSFLSVHFTTLPDAAFVERMRHGDLTAMLEALVNDESVEGDIATGASLMRAHLEKARHKDAPDAAQTLGVDRTRLYRGLSPMYGPPPPYEMVWSKTGQDVGLLVSLAGTYREMGMSPSPDMIERMDYIGVELDFMRELALREATAWESTSPESAQKLLEAQHTFMNEHLRDWVPLFVDDALKRAETDFYRGHMLMLRGFIASEQEELASLIEETSALRDAIPAA